MIQIKNSYILLESLRFHAWIGVGAQERVVGNDYLVDLKIEYPFAKALESDDVEDTLSYAGVYTLVKDIIQQPMFLLERAAGIIGKKLIEHYPNINSIHIKIIKQNPPMGTDSKGAGIELDLINDKS